MTDSNHFCGGRDDNKRGHSKEREEERNEWASHWTNQKRHVACLLGHMKSLCGESHVSQSDHHHPQYIETDLLLGSSSKSLFRALMTCKQQHAAVVYCVLPTALMLEWIRNHPWWTGAVTLFSSSSSNFTVWTVTYTVTIDVSLSLSITDTMQNLMEVNFEKASGIIVHL